MVASRILVTGSRYYSDETRLRVILTRVAQVFHTRHGEPPILVSGNAHGADFLAEKVWESLGWPIEKHPAEWNKHSPDCKGSHLDSPTCNRAGHRRNAEMANLGADVCVAFPIGESRGTRGMMKIAHKKGIPVIDASQIADKDLGL